VQVAFEKALTGYLSLLFREQLKAAIRLLSGFPVLLTPLTAHVRINAQLWLTRLDCERVSVRRKAGFMATSKVDGLPH
jgi:hypothetical protein